MEAQSHPKTALPLLALLVVASALGVAVAVLLAAVAMLLAAPAYADEGRLLFERRDGLARLLFTECDAQEDGHTRLVEAYHNPFDEPLAGVYVVRLPGDAVLERTAHIGPGETMLVELGYRRLRPRRVLAFYPG